jgi:ubiquinone/menaquinone biosynthesis C-methylase UbiE
MSFTKYEARGAYHWDELAGRLPTTYSARLHALYDWFLDEAVKRQPELIVDVGCGDAALTHLLAKRTEARVVGIEPEPRGVEVAIGALERAGSSAEVIEGMGETLPFADGDVSIVVMCELVEHLEEPDAVFTEAMRVLEPTDGTLLVSTPQWQHDDLREFHVHEYRADELERALQCYFADVVVLTSEPSRTYDRYMSSGLWRLAINTASLLGRNPFTDRRTAESTGRTWRQLLAAASRPRITA